MKLINLILIAAMMSTQAFATDIDFQKAISNSYDFTSGRLVFGHVPYQGAVTQTAVSVSTASTSVLAANTSRRYLLIQNPSVSANIYVQFEGTAATTAAPAIKIAPGGSYECPAHFCPTGAIKAISDVGTVSIAVLEG